MTPHSTVRPSLIALLLLIPQLLCAQISDSGDLFGYISDIISAMPGEGGDDYEDPSDVQMADWGQVLEHLLADKYADAHNEALPLDYRLVAYFDTHSTKTYYILEATGSNHWGTYVYNPDPTFQLVIQAPHPKKDYNTGKEGIFVFRETQSLFFCLSGTHRCNSPASKFSACDGQTSACTPDDSIEPFRRSDMAHRDTTIFQVTTDSLFQHYADTYFIQLHGFSKKETDPYVILSNGIDEPPPIDYIATLGAALNDEDDEIDFKAPHLDDWDRLVGFVNPQGRLINGSNDPCDLNPIVNSGRFIHMEQEKLKLRNDMMGWTKVANALTTTFTDGGLPLLWGKLAVEPYRRTSALIRWSTEMEHNTAYFQVERSTDGFTWEAVDRQKAAGHSSRVRSYELVDPFASGATSYYRIKQVDQDGTYSYSTRLVFAGTSSATWTLYPNPASKTVWLQAQVAMDETPQVFDMLGQNQSHQVGILESKAETISLDIGRLPAGLYQVSWGQHAQILCVW